jgi:predicted phosphoribosyltransferase
MGKACRIYEIKEECVQSVLPEEMSEIRRSRSRFICENNIKIEEWRFFAACVDG